MEKSNQVFERYELKYVLNKEEYLEFKNELLKHMKVDKYGISTIQSVYFDTPDNKLISRSIDKPDFKEKIRLRSYGLSNDEKPCYLEIKRKANGLVYKRRIAIDEAKAYKFINYHEDINNSQIERELKYFRNYYHNLRPAMLIIYERESFYKDNSEVRVTFDFNPRYRTYDVNLHTSLEGIPLNDNGEIYMEIKVLHNMPLWLTDIITKTKVKRRSISKYGEAYKREKGVLAPVVKKGEQLYGKLVQFNI